MFKKLFWYMYFSAFKQNNHLVLSDGQVF